MPHNSWAIRGRSPFDSNSRRASQEKRGGHLLADLICPSTGQRLPQAPSSYRALVIFSFSTLACFFTDSSLRVSEVAIFLRLMPLPAKSRSFPISVGVQACRCRSNLLAMSFLRIDVRDSDSRKGTPCEPRGSSRTLATRRGSRREIASHALRVKPK